MSAKSHFAGAIVHPTTRLQSRSIIETISSKLVHSSWVVLMADGGGYIGFHSGEHLNPTTSRYTKVCGIWKLNQTLFYWCNAIHVLMTRVTSNRPEWKFTPLELIWVHLVGCSFANDLIESILYMLERAFSVTSHLDCMNYLEHLLR